MSGVSGFTANLNVDYRKPVTIPSVLMLRAEITKREGRKLWLTGQLTDPLYLTAVVGVGLMLRCMWKALACSWKVCEYRGPKR